ncbi:MAG: DUF349 domain-containing protein [Muribaculaceae bacterium]|nr:DUF349 domain-containing protein [Muribaculaceae bacterium]
MTELKDSVLKENEAVEVENVSIETSEQELDVPAFEESVSKEEIPLPATRTETVEQIEKLAEGSVLEVKSEIDQLKQHYYKLRIQETEVARAAYEAAQAEAEEKIPFVVPVDELEERLKAALQNFKDKKAKFIAEQEAKREANLAQKQAVLDDMLALINDADNVNKRYTEFQQMQQSFKNITDIPATAVTSMWKTYQLYVEQFYDMLKINKELRDYDFKKNLEQKTALCEAAESLSAEKDVVAAFKTLQRLHDEWREAGPVDRELRESIWQRFKDASTEVNKRHQQYFENIKAKEREAEDAKTAICEKAESIDIDSLTSFGAWEEKTKEILSLQAEWKTLGFASRKVNTQLFERFRKTCDNFFAKKSEYYKEVKDSYTLNLEAKQRLCEKAESLKDSTDWQKTTERMIALQKEWKKVGAVPRKYSDAIWKRFVAACDYFFEQKTSAMKQQNDEEVKNLEAKKEILEKIKAFDESLEISAAEAELRAIIAEWNKIGFVPFKEKDKLNKAFKAELDKQFGRLNIQNKSARLSAYETSLKGGNSNKLYNEREKLLKTYERIKLEKQTLQNNMGFLSISSKQGNSFVKEMERKIKKLDEDMELIVAKIELIDKNM